MKGQGQPGSGALDSLTAAAGGEGAAQRLGRVPDAAAGGEARRGSPCTCAERDTPGCLRLGAALFPWELRTVLPDRRAGNVLEVVFYLRNVCRLCIRSNLLISMFL